jgi:hypothetical protein
MDDITNFIIKEISKIEKCKIKSQYEMNDFKYSDKGVVDTNKDCFKSKQAAESISCLVDLKLKLLPKNFTDEYYFPNKTINEWLKINRFVSEETSYGNVYIVSFLNLIDCICKISKPSENPSHDNLSKLKQEKNLLIEYFIGKQCLNNLRYYVPNFMYTISLFESNIVNNKYFLEPILDEDFMKNKNESFYYFDKNNNIEKITIEKYLQNRDTYNTDIKSLLNRKKFLICEYVSKISFFDYLKDSIDKNLINFEKFIYIFCQLLLALEIAQQKYGFCHYDLHLSNIMMKELNEKITYRVNFNCDEYEFITDIVPVIIDFGESRILYKNKLIHTDSESGLSIPKLKFMIPSLDMFCVLLDILRIAHYYEDKHNHGFIFKNKFLELFNFFENEPYDIYKINKGNNLTAKNKLFNVDIKKIIINPDKLYKSEQANKTPLQFLNWIILNIDFPQKADIKKHRVLFNNIPFDSMKNRFNNVLFGENLPVQDIYSELNDCVKINKTDTFIGLYYKIYICKEYCASIGLNTDKYNTRFDDISEDVKARLINNDIKILSDVNLNMFSTWNKNLTLALFESILQIKLNPLHLDEREDIQRFEKFSSVFIKCKNSIELFYIVQNTELYKIQRYKEWIEKFRLSKTFTDFKMYSERYDVTDRWISTLRNSKVK